ncbi:MAG: hypothetical protein CME06_03025 [Gemmatimonadetes bacterium]|nr:hypothetical protein [Gemmatimonadota bacterium]
MDLRPTSKEESRRGSGWRDLARPHVIEREGDRSPAWVVTYSDLVSLLMVFFILFFAVDKAGRISELEQALAEYQERQNLVEREFQPGEVVLRISGKVLFDSGKARLKQAAFPVLDEAFRIIRDNLLTYGPATVRVEGHTDNVPIHTLQFPSNWELSAARAVSVVRYYLEQGHFKPGDLQLMGYGEHKPLESNDTPDGRQRNRRVEIKIVRANFTPEDERTPGPADRLWRNEDDLPVQRVGEQQ